MAISFIPIRDKVKVTQNIANVKKEKGKVLKKLSTGKRTSDSGDGISEYAQILRLNKEITNYKNTVKDINLFRSKLESALMICDFVAYKYQELANIINLIPTNLKSSWTSGGTAAEVHDKNIRMQFQNEITIVATAINDFLALKINNEEIISSADWKINFSINGTPESIDGLANLSINTALGVDSDNLKKLVYESDGADGGKEGLYKSFNNTATGGSLVTNAVKATILAAAESAVKLATGNYNLLLVEISTLESREELANIAKANTEAALSVLEDIDIQEEVVNLLEAQVLEELSAEALKAIKDSARFVIRLVQS